MKLVIKADGRPTFRLVIPTGLALNRFTAAILHRCLVSHGVTISTAQLLTVKKRLLEYRRRHGSWVLTEVQCANGDYVKVQL